MGDRMGGARQTLLGADRRRQPLGKREEGEIHGFLGPNGAGKTITIRSLTTRGLMDSGTVSADGFDARRDHVEARQQIGAIGQQRSLEKGISVRENIAYHGLVQNLTRAEIRVRMAEPCSLMGLGEVMDALAKSPPADGRKGRRRSAPSSRTRADHILDSMIFLVAATMSREEYCPPVCFITYPMTRLAAFSFFL